jgi:hypothetical protein
MRRNDADVLIFLLWRARRSLSSSFARGRPDAYEIRNASPERYAGWMAAWRDAWHVIDRLIAAGVNRYQLQLL